MTRHEYDSEMMLLCAKASGLEGACGCRFLETAYRNAKEGFHKRLGETPLFVATQEISPNTKKRLLNFRRFVAGLEKIVEEMNREEEAAE